MRGQGWRSRWQRQGQANRLTRNLFRGCSRRDAHLFAEVGGMIRRRSSAQSDRSDQSDVALRLRGMRFGLAALLVAAVSLEARLFSSTNANRLTYLDESDP